MLSKFQNNFGTSNIENDVISQLLMKRLIKLKNKNKFLNNLELEYEKQLMNVQGEQNNILHEIYGLKRSAQFNKSNISAKNVPKTQVKKTNSVRSTANMNNAWKNTLLKRASTRVSRISNHIVPTRARVSSHIPAKRATRPSLLNKQSMLKYLTGMPLRSPQQWNTQVQTPSEPVLQRHRSNQQRPQPVVVNQPAPTVRRQIRRLEKPLM